MFGDRLRQWRRVRGLSQLDLALRTEISQRQISFLETGRSRPRMETVERLCVALDVPLRDRNALLGLAGLPPAFEETPAGDGTTAPFVAALERTLHAHAPYPGLIVNGWWDIVRINRPAGQLLGPVEGDNLAELLTSDAMRAVVENFDDFARAVLGRLRRDARATPFDARLTRLCATLEEVVGPTAARSTSICPTFRVGDTTARMFSLVGELTSAHDITLDELRVELLYPADDHAAAVFGGR